MEAIDQACCPAGPLSNHCSNYQDTREELTARGTMPDDADLVVIEADGGAGQHPFYIFAEAGSWVPRRGQDGNPSGGGGSRLETASDPTGT